MWGEKNIFFSASEKRRRVKKNWIIIYRRRRWIAIKKKIVPNGQTRVAVRTISALVQLSRAVSKHWHDHNSNHNGRVPSAKADDRTLTGRTVRGGVDEWRLTAAVVFTGCRGGRVYHSACAAASGRRPWRTMSTMSYLTARTATIERVRVRVRVCVRVRVRIPVGLLHGPDWTSERGILTPVTAVDGHYNTAFSLRVPRHNSAAAAAAAKTCSLTTSARHRSWRR